jgi:CBS domain-containing protein
MHNNPVSGIWWGLFGLFLHGSAEYAVRQTEGRTLLAGETVRRFVTPATITVPSHLTIADFVDRFVSQNYQRSFAVLDSGRLIGLITVQKVLALPRDKWPWLYVYSLTEQMSPDNTLPPDFSAADALDMMHRLQRESLLVADGQTLIGVVALRDLMAYLSISSKVDQDRPVKISR